TLAALCHLVPQPPGEASVIAFQHSSACLCHDRILDMDGPRESSVLLQFPRGNSEASRRSSVPFSHISSGPQGSAHPP
ncbi:unnamed protein product, partial [Gulo gulo]